MLGFHTAGRWRSRDVRFSRSPRRIARHFRPETCSLKTAFSGGFT